MTTPFSRRRRHSIANYLLAALLAVLTLNSCDKQDEIEQNNNRPSAYSSNVLDKWMSMQLRLMKNATGIPNQAFSRHFAYAGVAALESLAPGMPGHVQWSTRWNGLNSLPVIEHSVKYYYPANVNGAMAAINKAMFPNASANDKAAIDSLEAALKQEFLITQNPSIINASAAYGKAVANAVFSWADVDGYKNANNAYTPPAGPGLWKPTAPAFAAPATPYWGNNRTIIVGSIDNTEVGAPLSYSTVPGSPFHNMVKEIYDISQQLTDDQKAMAIFWRDVPGATTPGHWLSILQQVIRQKNSSLEKAALAYALTGTAINDALISCFKSKYQYNLVRPITYIREVMGYTTWNSYIGTPAHPEYLSAHAALSVAAAGAMEKIFGSVTSFTDHTYDYMGLAPRSFTSLMAIGQEAAQSRVYAGIHFQPTVDISSDMAKKVVANIFAFPQP